MFVREKKIGAYSYLYLVESVREQGRVKQRVIKNLGRKDAVLASGELDRLARSLSKLAQRSLVLSLLEDGSAAHPAARRIGPSGCRLGLNHKGTKGTKARRSSCRSPTPRASSCSL